MVYRQDRGIYCHVVILGRLALIMQIAIIIHHNIEAVSKLLLHRMIY